MVNIHHFETRCVSRSALTFGLAATLCLAACITQATVELTPSTSDGDAGADGNGGGGEATGDTQTPDLTDGWKGSDPDGQNPPADTLGSPDVTDGWKGSDPDGQAPPADTLGSPDDAAPIPPDTTTADTVPGSCVTDEDCDNQEAPECKINRCNEGTCALEVDDGGPCVDDDPCTWNVCDGETCGVLRGAGSSLQPLPGRLEGAAELTDDTGVLVVGSRATDDTGGETAAWVMKLKPGGMSDNIFPDLGSSAQSIAIRGDGQPVMGGYATATDGTSSPFLVKLASNGTNPEPVGDLGSLPDGLPTHVMQLAATGPDALLIGGHSLQTSGNSTHQGIWVRRLEGDDWVWTRVFTTEQKSALSLTAMSQGPTPDFNTEEQRLVLAGFLTKQTNETTDQWATAIGLETGSDVEQDWVYQGGQQQKNERFLDVVAVTHSTAVALGWSDKNGAEATTLDLGGQDHLVTLLAAGDPQSRVSTGLFFQGGDAPYHLVAGEISMTPEDPDSDTKLWVAQFSTIDFGSFQSSDTTAQQTLEATEGAIHPLNMVSLEDGGVLLVGEHGGRGAWWFLDGDGKVCEP